MLLEVVSGSPMDTCSARARPVEARQSSARRQAKRSVLGRFMLWVCELVFLQTLGLQRFALLKPATPEIKVAVASVFFSMEMFVIVRLILKNEYC